MCVRALPYGAAAPPRLSNHAVAEQASPFLAVHLRAFPSRCSRTRKPFFVALLHRRAVLTMLCVCAPFLACRTRRRSRPSAPRSSRPRQVKRPTRRFGGRKGSLSEQERTQSKKELRVGFQPGTPKSTYPLLLPVLSLRSPPIPAVKPNRRTDKRRKGSLFQSKNARLSLHCCGPRELQVDTCSACSPLVRSHTAVSEQECPPVLAALLPFNEPSNSMETCRHQPCLPPCSGSGPLRSPTA